MHRATEPSGRRHLSSQRPQCTTLTFPLFCRVGPAAARSGAGRTAAGKGHDPGAGGCLAAVLRSRTGGYNVALCRGIHTGFQRLQEQMENTESVAPKVTANQSKSDFSLFPPVPGQGSSLTWSAKKYEDIPIAHIKATYNNTHIQVVSPENLPFARTSCGTEGFRNAKKATAIAAQTAGIAAAAKACRKGVSHVRVVVKGLGPGRMSAIKGLTMGGLEVISITDNTPIPHNGCRPRKARRL